MASRAGRQPGGLRAQPRLPRRAVHARGGRDPEVSRPRPSPRTASCSPSSGCRQSTTTRWSARRPTWRAWSPAGSTAASTARSSTPTGSASSCATTLADGVVCPACAPARGTPTARGVLAVRHPAGRATSTTGCSLAGGEGTPEELLCITNVTADEVSLAVRGTDVLTGAVVDPLVLGALGVRLGAGPSGGRHASRGR